MQSLGDIFKFKANRSPLLRGISAAMTVEKANQILIKFFGEKIIDIAQAVYIKNRILSIACLSSVAAQEIKINEEKIIDEINQVAGQIAVAKIRYLA